MYQISEELIVFRTYKFFYTWINWFFLKFFKFLFYIRNYLNTLKKSLFIYFVHILEKKSLFFVRPVLNIQYKPKNMENIQD